MKTLNNFKIITIGLFLILSSFKMTAQGVPVSQDEINDASVTSDNTEIADFSLNVYPNPGTRETMKYSINAARGEKILVVVYDIKGAETYSEILILEITGENVFAVDPEGKLSPGIYIISATSNENVKSKKLIIR